MSTLGVCYYPEHWPRERWATDAQRMAELGLRRVRIGEFAWSVLEPEPGRYDFAWLDEAMDTLGAAGLGVILGTPTATPPKWLIDAHPEILPVGRDGRVRGFGSRRHTCFRNPVWLRETQRIVEALASRYGHHPALVAWQTDNEYGCHDTTRCWCPVCRDGFRVWLAQRYGTVDALNDAWWTTFWSQRYRSFDEVDLPEQAVTEANPSHRLDFRRFASDGVVAYDALQCSTIRRHSDRPITHNSMMIFPDYDHVDLAANLDVISFDNYPLGQLEESPFSDEEKERWLRVGHPDLVSLSHDLYRGLKDAPHWVMEQQPGQVNWAPVNPIPADGAVRAWVVQGLAHGAEMVSIFRWRAAVGAQETMHAGILRHDGSDDQAHAEVAKVAREIGAPATADVRASLAACAASASRPRVGILFDYEDLWATEIQPHARGFTYWGLTFSVYRTLRRLGVEVDLVPKKLAGRPASEGGRPLDRYAFLFAPTMPIVDEDLARRLGSWVTGGGRLWLGPRTGAKTTSLIAHAPAPGPLLAWTGAKVTRVDALRPGVTRTIVRGDGTTATYATWADLLEPTAEGGTEPAEVLATYVDPAYRGAAAYVRAVRGAGEVRVLGAWLSESDLTNGFERWLTEGGVATTRLPEGIVRAGDWTINFTDRAATVGGVDVGPLDAVRHTST